MTPDEIERVRALLQCWAEWRGTVRQVMRLRRTPQCNLGRLVRLARQKGELWEHNEVEQADVFDEGLMSETDVLIASLDWKIRNVIFMTYVDGIYLSTWQRAKKLGCSERTYFYRMNEAHKAILDGMEWQVIERRL